MEEAWGLKTDSGTVAALMESKALAEVSLEQKTPTTFKAGLTEMPEGPTVMLAPKLEIPIGAGSAMTEAEERTGPMEMADLW